MERENLDTAFCLYYSIERLFLFFFFFYLFICVNLTLIRKILLACQRRESEYREISRLHKNIVLFRNRSLMNLAGYLIMKSRYCIVKIRACLHIKNEEVTLYHASHALRTRTCTKVQVRPLVGQKHSPGFRIDRWNIAFTLLRKFRGWHIVYLRVRLVRKAIMFAK